MKFRLSLLLFIGLLAVAAHAPAQNRVLQLDGNGSYVELPPNIFNDLTEATVEGWLKWEEFTPEARFFDFGETWKSIRVSGIHATPGLKFVFGRDAAGQDHEIQVPDLLRTNQWCHIAAVT